MSSVTDNAIDYKWDESTDVGRVVDTRDCEAIYEVRRWRSIPLDERADFADHDRREVTLSRRRSTPRIEYTVASQAGDRIVADHRRID